MIQSILFGLSRFLVGGRAIWAGSQPHLRQRVYFANHGSHLDTILICAALPPDLRATTHPVAAADYWGKNALTRYISGQVLNAVLIDRKASRNPLEPLRGILDDGESLIIFPEGTRTTETLPQKLKSGLFHLARDYPDVEFVPTYLENLSRAYPKGAVIPAPISCTISFGAPIRLKPGEARDDFLNRARQGIIDLAYVDEEDA